MRLEKVLTSRRFERINGMKNKKRAFLYVVLIIVLIMSMASTASANVQYSGYFSRFVNTSGDVLLVTYVRNNNTRCYFSEIPENIQKGRQGNLQKKIQI